MGSSIIEDIKTVSELKKDAEDILAQLHRTGRPVVLTVDKKPDAVLLDVGVYARMLRTINLRAILVEAEYEAQGGNPAGGSYL